MMEAWGKRFIEAKMGVKGSLNMDSDGESGRLAVLGVCLSLFIHG